MLTYHGYDIISSSSMVTVTRHRVKTHRKKRIDKKYEKRYGYWEETRPLRSFIMDHINKRIYAHPSMMVELEQAMKLYRQKEDAGLLTTSLGAKQGKNQG